VKNLWNSAGLEIEEKGVIRPVKPRGKKEIFLRLERWFEHSDSYTVEERTVCEDVSNLSPNELANVLKTLEIDLSKPPYWEEGDEEETGEEDRES
jgi:hypothetical protein